MSEPPSMRPGPFVPQENHPISSDEEKIGADGLPPVNQELAIGVDGVAHGVIDCLDFSDLSQQLDIDAIDLFGDSALIPDPHSATPLNEVRAEAVLISDIAVSRGIEVVEIGRRSEMQSSYISDARYVALIDCLERKQDLSSLLEQFHILLGVQQLDAKEIMDPRRYLHRDDLRFFDRETGELHGASQMPSEEFAKLRDLHGDDIKEVVHDKESWMKIVDAFSTAVDLLVRAEQTKEKTSKGLESEEYVRKQATVGKEEHYNERTERAERRGKIESTETRTKHKIAQGILSDIQKEEMRRKEREKKAAEKERDIERTEIKKHQKQESIVKKEISQNEKRKRTRNS